MEYFISIAALVALFTIATMTPVNMGVLAFTCAFVVGTLVSGISTDEIYSFFPGDLFLIIVGITLMFGIARTNGTIDLIVAGALKLVRGKRWAIVWLMFFLGAGLMTLGSVLAVGMLAPIAMPIARRFKIDPLLMGMMISHGVLGAAFSPITLYGAFTNGWLRSAGLPTDPLALYLIPLGLSFLLALALFLVKGRDLMRGDDIIVDLDAGVDGVSQAQTRSMQLSPRGIAPTPGPGGLSTTSARPTSGPMVITTDTMAKEDSPERLEEVESAGFTPLRVITLLSMLGLLVGVAVFKVDIGICAIVISAFLLLIAPNKHKTAANNVTWSAVLLVCGMITYMGVLQANGTLTYLGEAAAGIDSPLLTAYILLLSVAVVSAVGSSIGTLGIVLPLAAPLIASGDLSLIGLVAALSFAAVVVDVSPLSSNGVMVLANAEVPDKQKFQTALFKYTGYVVLVAPILAWAFVVVPTSL